MSKIFYDHLITLEEIEIHIKESVETYEERRELWQIVDEIVHHRVLGCILDHLPHNHHQEFLQKFHSCPYDEGLLDYLRERIKKDVEEIIRKETENLASEILKEIKNI
jgi:hypothetical protein